MGSTFSSTPSLEPARRVNQEKPATISRTLRDSISKSLAASDATFAKLREGCVVPSAGYYQWNCGNARSRPQRSKKISAVGKAHFRCPRCDRTWNGPVKVIFDLGRMGVPKLSCSVCYNCGDMVKPSFSCLEWDKLANEALRKYLGRSVPSAQEAQVVSKEHWVSVPDPEGEHTVKFTVNIVKSSR